MPYDLDLSRVQPLLSRLDDVFSPGTGNAILTVAGNRVGAAVVAKIADYPPASGNALPLYYTRVRKDGTTFQSKFKSQAQQALVMRLVKQGKVPYQRTGTLAASLRFRATIAASGVIIIDIGAVPYSVYVINRPTQSHYHMGTWPTVQDDIEQDLAQLSRLAVETVTNEVSRRLSE